MMGGLQYDTTRIEAARRRKSSAQISLQTVRQKRKVDNALVALMHCFEPCSPCCHRTAVAFDFSDSCDFCGLITEIVSLKDSEESLSCNQTRKQFSFQRSVVGYPIVLRLCVLPDHRQPIPFVVGRLALKKYSAILGLRICRTPVLQPCTRMRPADFVNVRSPIRVSPRGSNAPDFFLSIPLGVGRFALKKFFGGSRSRISPTPLNILDALDHPEGFDKAGKILAEAGRWAAAGRDKEHRSTRAFERASKLHDQALWRG